MILAKPSKFRIAVVHADTGHVVQWAPGLAAERDFVQELSNRVAARMGWWRSRAAVAAALEAATKELLHELKSGI
jgi:hypothetical protein